MRPNKSCDFDLIPTWLLRQCLDHFMPLIIALINKSLATSVVQEYFKRAVVKPLFKRPGFNTEEFNNYRPVSNLPYTSKLLEKVVEHCMPDHLLVLLLKPWIGCGQTSAVEHVSAPECRLMHIYVVASHKDRCWARSFTVYTPIQLVELVHQSNWWHSKEA